MDNDLVFVKTPVCPFCGQAGSVVAPRAGVAARKAGALIQDAFPSLAPDEREQIQTGIHQQCWDAVIPDPEKFDEDDSDPIPF